jgi:5-formyltetrahydrofolate cyclo-ligase
MSGHGGTGPKADLRRAHWAALRAAGAARFPGVEGRIPNFVGAEAAARRLADTPEFRAARVLKCNPDLPQRPVRHAALKAGKVVILAVPRLRERACFLALAPEALPEGSLWKASSIKGAFELGVPLTVEAVPPIDLVVSGCVAVGEDGARLGKGGGYADLEYALLRAAGALAPDTPVATTVHPSQVCAAGTIPRERHDVGLTLVATPDRLVRPAPLPAQPSGLHWDALPAARIAEMPALAARAPCVLKLG